MTAMRSYLAELIATGLFVFLGAGTVMAVTGINAGLDTANLLAIALAHGLAIFLLVSAIGHISGGHINPAVTIALAVSGKISPTNAAAYVAAQLIGGVIGAFLLTLIFKTETLGLGAHSVTSTHLVAGTGSAFILEIIVSFALVFVIFATAVDKMGTATLAPLAIGMTVLVDHLVAVPFTGASMNPARTFGPALLSNNFADHWIYWAGPIIGAVAAGVIYTTLLQKED